MTTDTVFPSLDKTQPLDVNLQHLRDQPRTALEAFGDEWAANCAGSALTEIARLQAQVDALAGALQLAMPLIEQQHFLECGSYGKNHSAGRSETARARYEKARTALAAIGALT